jgi:hypothetical protein
MIFSEHHRFGSAQPGMDRSLLRPALVLVLAALTSPGLIGCSKDENGGGDSPEPVTLDSSRFTYRLEESTSKLTLWTTPCTHKVRTNERPPEETDTGLSMSAARNEVEPVQLVVGPSGGAVSVSVDEFPLLGADQRINLSMAEYRDGWAEGLAPLEPGEEVTLSNAHGTPIWVTVYVPRSAPAGEHETTIHVDTGSSVIEVPLRLYVFDFELPAETHFSTQLNVSISALIPEGGTVDDAKSMLFSHRLTPKSVTWPSGFNPSITWENDRSSDVCEVLWDEPDEPDQYSIGWLARRYILGEGWNEVGFPTAMLFQFVDNSTPRPAELCSIPRGDHYGSEAYNAEWSQFLSALETYLRENGMLEKAYYYVQNEPQDEEDHRLAAHLCRLTKGAAPDLRIAISEEPKPEIAEHPDGPCGYDIWIAHVRAYEQDYAWQRQADFGEEVWLYSLDHDPDPYFNPTRVDLQGMHQRIIPWVSWRYRATGWAYYDANRFFDGSRPTIRAELLREGIEDYEYLYLANGSSRPQAHQEEAVDPTVDSVASSLTSWCRDADALMALRHELGLYIEGSRQTIPVLESDTDIRPRGEYFISFQDPDGPPTADPLTVDGKTYMKIGWLPYDEEAGYGWYGEHVENPSIALYGYDDVSGYTEVQKSYVYDDYGRDNLFELALENGRYEVTIGVGRPARGYPGDPHNAVIEGVTVVDDEPTTDSTPLIERTVTVDLTDGSLSVEVGGLSASTGEWSYTFLGYLEIAPVH